MVTYSDLVIFRNELKNKEVPRYKLIGIASELIISFADNDDADRFLRDVLDLIMPYSPNTSRMTMIATSAIWLEEKTDLKRVKDNLYGYVCRRIDESSDKSDQKNTLDGWMGDN